MYNHAIVVQVMNVFCVVCLVCQWGWVIWNLFSELELGQAENEVDRWSISLV